MRWKENVLVAKQQRVQTQARVSEWDACKKYSDHSFHYHFYLYSIVDVVFPFIFLFRDVILTQSTLGCFFFPLGGRACRKAWCCMWKRDFWHCGTPTSRAELCISSLVDFLQRRWNIQLRHESVALDVCVCVCLCQVCLTKVRVLIVLLSSPSAPLSS